MSILFSGDFNANNSNDLMSVSERLLIKRHGPELYGKIKYHIVLGDAKFMWDDNRKKDMNNLKTFAVHPFPILCVFGEHEPVCGMKDIKEVDIGIGEKVYEINNKPFVAYLKRGKVYTIDGIKFLVLGGSMSKDKNRQIQNKRWEELEYWTEQKKQELFKLLESENRFDFVISHTGPHHINKIAFERIYPYSEKFKDEAAFLNDEVHNKINFCEWLCANWHNDKIYTDENTKLRCHYLYRKTKVLDLNGNSMQIFSEGQYEMFKRLNTLRG